MQEFDASLDKLQDHLEFTLNLLRDRHQESPAWNFLMRSRLVDIAKVMCDDLGVCSEDYIQK